MGRPRQDIENAAAYPEINTAAINTANSTTITDAVDLEGLHLVAIGTPGTLVSTSVGLQVSRDGASANYKDLYDSSGNKYSITVGINRVIYLDPSTFAGFQYIRLVCGSAEANGTTFYLYCRYV